LGVVYNRYPFPSPSSPAKNTSSCKLGEGGVRQPLSFWEASSQIRLAPPLVAAAADLYSRHLNALWEKTEENNFKAKGPARQGGKALCVHWRRADFKTYRPECLLSAFVLFLFQTGALFAQFFVTFVA
jgi:hypothetical protein